MANNTNDFIGIIGAVLFAVLTIFIPFFRIIGGFLQNSVSVGTMTMKVDYHWNVIITSMNGYTDAISYAEMGTGSSDIAIIWGLIPLWGYLWFGLGIIGAVLVTIPPLMRLLDVQPIITPVRPIGLIVGFIATLVELGLFFLIWLLEDWGISEMGQPDLNFILVGCFFLGWVALIIAYSFPEKQ
ncbi:MAG: hypothetical protein ACFFB5_07885 [Promethearchaeota archaeon]